MWGGSLRADSSSARATRRPVLASFQARKHGHRLPTLQLEFPAWVRPVSFSLYVSHLLSLQSDSPWRYKIVIELPVVSLAPSMKTTVRNISPPVKQLFKNEAIVERILFLSFVCSFWCCVLFFCAKVKPQQAKDAMNSAGKDGFSEVVSPCAVFYLLSVVSLKHKTVIFFY